MQITGGQTFYYRLCEARENQDRPLLEALYHPDAVSFSLSTGQVTRGREAILDSFKQTFQVAGAISLRSVESLVEAGEAVCVEATLSTRSAQIQTYDVYLLQAGICAQHVGGLISPRPPVGQGSFQGWPQTKGATFYHRLCQAQEAQDVARLSSLYHPDGVACSSNQSSRGREAIINSFKQVTANSGSVSLKSVESFMESSEIICAEVTRTIRFVNLMGSVQFDALTYDVLVLRADQIGQSFSGLISPRGHALQQAVKPQREPCVISLFPQSFRRW
jgi:ketosteroid isomerase-like protein